MRTLVGSGGLTSSIKDWEKMTRKCEAPIPSVHLHDVDDDDDGDSNFTDFLDTFVL